MILIFQGGNEFVKLDMNRKKKVLLVTSSKTNMVSTKTDWQKLFDPGKEKEQEEITNKLNDEDFKKVIIEGMCQFGYTIKRVEN